MKIDIGVFIFAPMVLTVLLAVVDSICYSIEKAVRKKWQKRGIQRLKHFENKQRLIAEYAEFLALATAYGKITKKSFETGGIEE